jgi:hypothetical protein
MKKLAVFALVLLLIPSAFAIIAQTHYVQFTSSLIGQGYFYAHVQGVNLNSEPVQVVHWHLSADLGLSHAFCELQPATIPPGPFDVEIAASCQTRSQFTTLFPKGTKMKIDSFVPDDTPQQPGWRAERFSIDMGARVPTPFPIAPIGHVIIEEQANPTGTFMFFAGMGAIVVLTIAVILFSLRREE